MKTWARIALGLLLGGAAYACGGDDGDGTAPVVETPDGSTEPPPPGPAPTATVDPPETGAPRVDAGTDAGLDAGADADADADADVPDAAPDAAIPDASMPDADAGPTTFAVRAVVTGLTGAGLALKLEAGATTTVPISAAGTTILGTFAKGTSYQVRIATQPAGQVCHVTKSKGQIASADVDVDVACAAPDLLINEVSNCHFGNDACWFEVANPSSGPIDLGGYTLRTTAVNRDSPTALLAAQSFTIPSVTIPAGGYAIVRGRASASIIDGPRSVSVLAGTNLIPHWGDGLATGTGFIELVKAGKTVDFVRFGSSTATPTTGEWIGASAAGWPSGDQSFQRGIARLRAMVDTDSADDWPVRAFPTPGGVNDITDGTDADADGIPDQAEVAGGTLGGLDLFAMGARTGKKDVFLEIDRMTSTDPGIVPQRTSLDMVVAAFAPHGIAIHIDAGDRFAASFDPANYNLGGGNAVPFAELVTMGAEAGSANLYTYKAAHFDVRRHWIFHYVLFGNKAADGSGGLGEFRGNDILVTIGGTFGGVANASYVTNTQASALMHELGHNLGLRHGGNDETNFKPNYISVMNYLYASFGLPIIGTKEGDRYYLHRHNVYGVACGGVNTENDLFRSRSGTQFVLDYSNGSSVALVESAIDESKGLGRTGSVAVDYNCDGATTSGVSLDVNDDGKTTTLTDYDDWGHLDLAFGRYASSTDAVGTATTFDPLGNDRQPLIRELPTASPQVIHSAPEK